MGVQRFSSFEAAEEALWCRKPDAAYLKRIHDLFETAAQLAPRTLYQPGVYRFTSIEEAQRHRDDMELRAAVKTHDKLME